MRHDRDRYRDHQYVPDTFWLLAAALLFAACGLVWLIGQVAAILFGRHHEYLPVRLVGHRVDGDRQPAGLDAWAACTSRPDHTMGSVYGTAETLLDVYGDPQIAASAEGCDSTLTSCWPGPTTRSTCMPRPASRSGSGRCLSSWSAW